MALDFPGSEAPLAFAAKNVAFNPKGVSSGALTRLMLVTEYKIYFGNNILLRLKPDGTNYVEWDCNGFKSVSLKGFFEFAPGLLLPDSSATSDKVVTASFQLITSDIHNFVADVNITPFCIKGLKDFSFSVKDATVDLSEIVNIPGMTYPKGYQYTNGPAAAFWTGFYIRQLQLKLPTELSKNGKRIEINATNFLIDKMGVSGNINVANLFSLAEGSMNSWPFSVDQFSLNIIYNRLNGASISGGLQIPFTTTALNYSASIFQNFNTDELDYSFLIQSKNGLKIPAFAATINLYSSSTIVVQKANGTLLPTATLNGDITINSSGLTIPSIRFEKLFMTSERPYIKGGYFATSALGSAAIGGFACSLDSICLSFNNLHPELDVTGTFNFMGKGDFGFSATTTARVIGKIEETKSAVESATPITKTTWSFDRIAVGDIGLDVETQPYRIKGGITYKEKDLLFGNGFFGSLSFELKSEPAKFNPAVNAGFGTKASMHYWYADGIVSTSIPLGSIAEIKRLMGGMYYHMKPSTGFMYMATMLYKNTNSVVVPVNYIPDSTAGYGFRAGVTFSSVKSEKVFNGDMLLTINLNKNGGLSSAAFDGDVVSLASISDRQKQPASKQKIYGSMHMTYDNSNQSFHALFNAKINVPGIVSGNGQAIIHFDPKEWYVCIGKPSAPINVSLLNFAAVRAYFMMGHSLEPMPAPPSLVTDIVNGYGLKNSRNSAALQGGNGVATGANFSTGISNRFGNEAVNVNYSLYAVVGFDVMAADYGTNTRCSNTNDVIGINGWYFQGQAYLGLQGLFRAHVDVDLRAFHIKTDLDVLSLSAAAILQAQAPKPTYFYADVAVHIVALSFLSTDYHIPFSYGTTCGTIVK
ncbi:MAG: hypothetical protein IT235_02560 [Bacteroidia bacterium]|nr:hypothetical protein [Bacteroidia bacterium]